jgi:glycogen operon protein
MTEIFPGRSFPIGARLTRRGVNFSVYSRGSIGMDLLLFDHPNDPAPARVITLDIDTHNTYHYWHVLVPGIRPGQLYAYRAHGPFDPDHGLRFDPEKVLLDPYGRAVVFPRAYDRGAACLPGDNAATAPKSVVVDLDNYDWDGDRPIQQPLSRTVIYEMHVAGFTRHPNSEVAPEKRGTYAGLIDKIPYLRDLGVTAVELLPVFAFDPWDAPSGKANYWGYSPLSFFAPHPFYSSDQDPLGPLDEFRDMVKALHRQKIEVILDVVFNHTTEGGDGGPTLCYRGLDNEAYYILDSKRRGYANYTGCGNTLNGNHPIVRRMILDSLRYWVSEMHVDGFRFDLASILARDEDGIPLANPPILFDIESDPVLAGTKLIAEAWDAAGLYQVGSFVGDFWKEWNGKFRDDIRSWVKGDEGSIQRFPARMLASPDIFEHENREPEQSVNFVTCHDGFTLNDVVSYDRKHNEANGEGNRDGSDNNLSWNHGVEGPSQDPNIEMLRERDIKNFFAYTLLAMGTPMLLMGDEIRRTQCGNNNAYSQDNELSWLDWSQVENQTGLRRFVRKLIRFRLRYGVDINDDHKTLTEDLREAKIAWHGVRLNQPDWSPGSHSLGLTLTNEIAPGRPGQYLTHMVFNAYWSALDFEMPPLPPGSNWRLLLDTCLAPPDDIYERSNAPQIDSHTYRAAPRSVVVFVADIK